jgi:hypothetical protein
MRLQVKTPRYARTIGIVLLVLLTLLTVLGIYWSRTPKVFWVNEFVDDGQHVVGYSTADTLIRVASTLLDKPGGYLFNDRMPPGVWLDNIPNWEKGVLTQVTDLARVMRSDYSRSKSQNIEESDPVGSLVETIGAIRHIHISENHRGAPGSGHIDHAAAIRAAKAAGYDGWFTVEAFGQALPDLAAATRVWRPLFEREDDVVAAGARVIRDAWAS